MNETRDHRLKGWDTLYQLDNQSFIRVTVIDSTTCKLSWGTAAYENVSKGTFAFGEFETLPIDTFNSEYALLSKSCGIKCKALTILPFTKGAIDRTILFAKAWDIRRNLVAYTVLRSNSLINLTVEQYKSGIKRTIRIDSACTAIDKQECITRCRFDASSLIVEYDGIKNHSSAVLKVDSLLR